MRTVYALLLVMPCAIGANQPTFTRLLPAGLSVSIIALDAATNAYLAGTTNADAVPVTPGAFQTQPGKGSCAVPPMGTAPCNHPFVIKLDPAGKIVYATYLGGEADSLAIAVDSGGNGAFVTSLFVSPTVMNAASYVANIVAHGEIVATRGYGLGPQTGSTANGPAYAIAGTDVFFDEFQAPMFYAQANQISAQVPLEIAGRTSVQVTIRANDVAGTFPVAVASSSPGIFYVINSDGTPNSPSNPAQRGDFISIYGTGGGLASPPGQTGGYWPLTPLSNLILPVSVVIGAATGQKLYAGSAPTLESGFFQINVVIPAVLPASTGSLYVTVGHIASSPVPIAIQ